MPYKDREKRLAYHRAYNRRYRYPNGYPKGDIELGRGYFYRVEKKGGSSPTYWISKFHRVRRGQPKELGRISVKVRDLFLILTYLH